MCTAEKHISQASEAGEYNGNICICHIYGKSNDFFCYVICVTLSECEKGYVHNRKGNACGVCV